MQKIKNFGLYVLENYSRIFEQTDLSPETFKLVEKVLPKAIAFWREWLNSPITKQKFYKNYKSLPKAKLDEIYAKYFDLLNKTTIVDSASDSDTDWDLRKYAYAYVKSNGSNIIYIQGSLNGVSDELVEETLIHEIQHLIYHILPLNPNVKIDNCYDYRVDKKPKGLKNKLIALFKKEEAPKPEEKSIKIDRISKNFSISPSDAELIYTGLKEVLRRFDNSQLNYIKSSNENLSRVIALRKKFKVNPGEDIKLSSFNQYIIDLVKAFKEKNEESVFKSENLLGFIILNWAYNGFRDFNNFLNDINTLALNAGDDNKTA